MRFFSKKCHSEREELTPGGLSPVTRGIYNEEILRLRLWMTVFGLRMTVSFMGIFLTLSPLQAFESSNEIRRFGDSLYQEADYYRAITEYKKFLYAYPDHPRKEGILFSIGFSYLKGEQWEAALPYFQALSLKNHPPLSEYAQLMLGQTYMLSQKYLSAVEEWQQFLIRYPRSSFLNAARYQTAWSAFLLEDMEQTRRLLLALSRDAAEASHPWHQRASLFLADIDRWLLRPSRSPTLAGILSAMVPGAGQWYTGHLWDGGSALAVNAAFAYGITYTFRHDMPVAGGILTAIGLGFYTGNIFSAVSNAHKFNQEVKASLRAEFKTKHGIDFEWNGMSLNVKF